MSIHSVECNVGTNPITIETGKMARLADGAVVVRSGDTVVLVTVVSATKVKEGQTFFPLSVEYKEKAAAAGMFPGGYFKREGRPTEKEILTCRMTDRPLRPMFPKGYFYDTQVITLLLSADGENEPDILSINGASAACVVSDLPFAEPVGAVRVGRIDGQFVINPTNSQREHSQLDLVFAGTKDQVIMIEGSANELPEEDFIAALRVAQENVKVICEKQEELRAVCGKEKRAYELCLAKPELLEIGYEIAGDRIEEAIYAPSKVDRQKKVGALRDEVEAAIKERHPEATDFDVEQVFEYIQKKAFRISIMEKDKRADGRALKQLRPLTAEVNVLPPVVHGSAMFARGETMSLCLATLAPMEERQYMDNYTGSVNEKRFILHYNFPPFSVGDTGRFGGQNRREIGHGALAERSIAPVVPGEQEFPYAIRVSSEIMESNGSTSMASVCAGTMSLLAAGVPLKRPVAGISVGLVTEQNDQHEITSYKTLLDIIGSEDFYGDMDFKLCGTSEGVTGYQLDLKLPGIPLSILEEAIHVAKAGRTDVLKVMNEAIAAPAQMSPNAPRIETTKIPADRIGELIGPGGKNIKAIQAESGADINIEEDGTVHIYAAKQEGLDRALELVTRMFKTIEIGELYTGKIVSTTTFGAFMEVLPGKDGLIHISELAEGRTAKTEDVVSVGDVVTAKCIGIDDKGRVKMSIRAALRDAKAAEAEAAGITE
ncbi:polyribonucleotide nucleotidyltransferase [Akkermansia muciniphila]|uniref:polyribonucleotide nucleotidyltransferase n=1 Tax=Akkermansia muciniphila TaxID=239935 RepID=UPI00138E82AD|nr:polyribonucleotide nucleotidyltransferase [Akkermansia muciniphila]QHV64883.1 polyribonucleotide nucleotidyltransferase [Akkermansia muciniphila]QHV67334.1 polyribonucleotide nucleotidyltransferase [Akkermansia muciniphila]QHV69800.1 polyribonucleotide nucleotidyltransferase [Akkermansia muciniphila]QHV72252.1 polyribonucleotide nucleotidyltransferase [Akkermansia muciniphila]HJE12504.1 polyribonucleotide nucleotidyltransferase [Akkermansia muciniphila]